MQLTKSQKHLALHLRSSWLSEGVNSELNGREAAGISIDAVGYVAKGLTKTQNDESKTMSIAYVAACVARAMS